MAYSSLNDWQTMHTRKEVEEIRKSCTKGDEINNAFIFDLILVILGFALDKSQECTSKEIASVLFIVASVILVPTVVIWVIRVVRSLREKHLRKRIKSIKEIIDLIDNKLCYYLMTAQGMIDAGIGTADEVETFNLIEASYYVNKCVQILASIGNNLQAAIVPGEGEHDYLKRKISATRIYNILSLIVRLYSQIDSATAAKDGKSIDVSISRVTSENQYYKGKLISIKQNVACFLKDYPDIEIT